MNEHVFRLMRPLVIVVAFTGPAAVGDDVYHVGYQNDCMLQHPDVGSFFDGDIWYGLVPPGQDDTALFGTGFDPQGNGLRPHVLHFGDFCCLVPECPEPVAFNAGEGRAANLLFASEDWTFDFRPGRVGECQPPGSAGGGLTVGSRLMVGVGEGADAGLELAGGEASASEVLVGGDGGTGRLQVSGEP